MAAERRYGDDTTVPALEQGRTIPASCGPKFVNLCCDDKPFGSASPPAAIFHCSCDRRGEDPRPYLMGYAGILQADPMTVVISFICRIESLADPRSRMLESPLRAELIRRFSAAIILWPWIA